MGHHQPSPSKRFVGHPNNQQIRFRSWTVTGEVLNQSLIYNLFNLCIYLYSVCSCAPFNAMIPSYKIPICNAWVLWHPWFEGGNRGPGFLRIPCRRCSMRGHTRCGSRSGPPHCFAADGCNSEDPWSRSTINQSNVINHHSLSFINHSLSSWTVTIKF